MAYTYSYTTPEQDFIRRTDGEGNSLLFPADPASRHYAEFLASGATAEPYVAPPVVVDSRTSAQKLEDATGLTIAEIKEALEL